MSPFATVVQGSLGRCGVVQRTPDKEAPGPSPVIDESRDPMDEAHREAHCDALYAQKADEFEVGMGPIIAKDPNADAAATALFEAVHRILDAYAEHTRPPEKKLKLGPQVDDRALTYESELEWAGGERGYGAVEMLGETLKRIFAQSKSLPLRTKLKIVYSAAANNNLGKWIEVAVRELTEAAAGRTAPIAVHRTGARVRDAEGKVKLDEGGRLPADYSHKTVRPGFAKASGLDQVYGGDALASAAHRIAERRGTVPGYDGDVVSGDDTYSPLLGAHAAILASDGSRRINRISGIPSEDQESLRVRDVDDLTDAEIRQILTVKQLPIPLPSDESSVAGESDEFSRQRAEFLRGGTEKLLWLQGEQKFDVIPNSDVEAKAAEIHARLVSGISGSSDLMFAAAKVVGVGDVGMLRNLRLAMLGWMLQNRDHSFYEIMRAAELHGLEFKTDPARRGYEYEAKENFAPMETKAFQDILPEKVFPGHFATPAFRSEVKLTGPHKNADELRSDFTKAGVSPRVVAALSPRALADLAILNQDVAAAVFRTTESAPRDPATALLNHEVVRKLQRSAPYLSLVHAYPSHAPGLLMSIVRARHGADALNATETLLAASQDALPSVGTSLAKQREGLIAAGVPAGAIADAPDHLIPDIVQLQAIVQTELKGAVTAPTPAQTTQFKATVLFQHIVERLSTSVADLILAKCYQASHAGFESAAYGPQADELAAKLVTAGVPLAYLQRLNRTWWPTLSALTTAIHEAARLEPPAQKVAFDEAIKKHSALKDGILAAGASFRPRYFDAVVYSVAGAAGIALPTGSPEAMLADLGGFLRPGATKIPVGSEAKSFELDIINRHFGGDPEKYTKAIGGAKLAFDYHLNESQEGRLKQLDVAQYKDVSGVEQWGIYDYSMYCGQGKWQQAIEGIDPSDVSDSGLGGTHLRIRAAISGLNKIPPYAAGAVFHVKRELTAPAEDEAAVKRWIASNYPIGHRFTVGNFLSSAKSMGSLFIASRDYDVVWEISNIKTGRDIQALAHLFEEEEVLFPPGANLVVTAVTRKDAKVWVSLMEV